jgi:hypothetical protein
MEQIIYIHVGRIVIHAGVERSFLSACKRIAQCFIPLCSPTQFDDG